MAGAATAAYQSRTNEWICRLTNWKSCCQTTKNLFGITNRISECMSGAMNSWGNMKSKLLTLSTSGDRNSNQRHVPAAPSPRNTLCSTADTTAGASARGRVCEAHRKRITFFLQLQRRRGSWGCFFSENLVCSPAILF